MRVLVTGGAGFIGSHLTQRLLAAGHGVRVLDNLSSGRPANLPSHPRLEFVQGDVRDARQVDAAVTGADAVFHLAAVASVQASVDDPIGTHGSNFLGTLNLLEAARRHGARRFVYASSAAVYGDTVERPVDEDAVLKPKTPYATDKLAGEHYLDFYCRNHGLRGTAFRFFNVYGPRQDPSSPYSGVISIFAQRARRGDAVTIFGDGLQTRDFVYVDDVVEILLRSLESSGTHGRVMNVGRGSECSLREILDELRQLVGKPIERRHAPFRAGDIRHSCADIRRLQEVLQFAPSTPLHVGLARLLEHGD